MEVEGVRKRHHNARDNENTNHHEYRDFSDGDDDEPLLGNNTNNNNNNTSTIVVADSFYDTLWSAVSFFWKSMYETLGWSIPLDEPTKSSLLRLKNILAEPFNKDNESHMLSLKQFWDISFNGEVIDYQLVSGEWKRLGFQSDDPMRDFRGTGIFGLEQLLFFADQCPKKFRHILDFENKRGEMYPFVVASFNVTMLLFELLGWGWKNKGVSSCANQSCFTQMVKIIFPTPDEELTKSKFALNIMYCIAMIIVDEKWDKLSASYMDFPNVLSASQIEFEKIFNEPTTLHDLIIYLESIS